MATASRPHAQPTERPFLGLRRRPGRAALSLMRVPMRAYRHDNGWMLGRTFIAFTHVGLGRDTFEPEVRFLSDDEALRVAKHFRRDHPYRLRLACSVLGWGDLRDDRNLRAFVSGHPFLALRPVRAEPARLRRS